jgi:tRNA dimethylallyltransferase
VIRPGGTRTEARAVSRPPRNNSAGTFALVGPTASGKTELSVELARRLGAEILVVDSMTVYRGMDVGTAKPSAELRRQIPHHLLDVADPAEPFSVAQFQALAKDALRDVADRGRAALLVGGSGLYYRAVVDDLAFPGTDHRLRRTLETEAAALGPHGLYERLREVDPDAAKKIQPSNLRRTVRALEVAGLTGQRFSSFATAWDSYPRGGVRTAGLSLPADVRDARIKSRVREMLEGGLIEEVRSLLANGAGDFLTASQAIGYLEVVEHLRDRLTIEEVVTRTERRTRDLARRQMAWFRRDPRIRWFETRDPRSSLDEIEEYFRG